MAAVNPIAPAPTVFATSTPCIVALQAEQYAENVAYSTHKIWSYGGAAAGFSFNKWPAGGVFIINGVRLTASFYADTEATFQGYDPADGRINDRHSAINSLIQTINSHPSLSQQVQASTGYVGEFPISSPSTPTDIVFLTALVPGKAGAITLAAEGITNSVNRLASDRYVAPDKGRQTTLGGRGYGVWVQVNGVYVDGSPDINGRVWLDVAEYLRPLTSNYAPLPPVGGGWQWQAVGIANALQQLVYGEQFTGGPNLGEGATPSKQLKRYPVGTLPVRIIPGAYSSEEGNTEPAAYIARIEAGNSTAANVVQQGRELTKGPMRPLFRSDGVAEPASFYVTAWENPRIRGVATYLLNDGAETEREVHAVNLLPGRTVQPVVANLSSQALLIDQVEAETERRVIYVDVAFQVRASWQAEWRTFATFSRVVDEVDNPRVLTPVIWRNSFGFWETTYFEGVLGTSVTADRQTYEQSRGFVYPDYPRQVQRIMRAETTETLTMRTGLYQQALGEWLADLVASTEHYTIATDSAGARQWAPILLTTHTLQYDSESKHSTLECVFEWSQRKNTLRA